MYWIQLFLCFAACYSSSAAMSRRGNKMHKRRAIEDIKWHCNAICFANGGNAEFNEITATCKCFMGPENLDEVNENLMLKNAHDIGLPLKIIKKQYKKKHVSKRDLNHEVIDQHDAKVNEHHTTSTSSPHTTNSQINTIESKSASSSLATSTESTTKCPETSTVPVDLNTIPTNTSKTTNNDDDIVGAKAPLIHNFQPRIPIPTLPSLTLPTARSPTFTKAPDSIRLVLDSVSKRLNALVNRVNEGPIDSRYLTIEIQNIRSALGTIDGERARTAERAMEQFREREKLRRERFRQLTHSFGRNNPLVGKTSNVDTKPQEKIKPVIVQPQHTLR